MPVASTRKNNGYLSEMVDYLAAVGDVVSTWDDGPTEGHNYFAMLGQSPQEILSILVTPSGLISLPRLSSLICYIHGALIVILLFVGEQITDSRTY